MKKPANPDKPRCGLCGKTGKLMRTDCCGQWICDDEHKYVLFSYARNSCSRNHRRYTLCSFHHTEKHPGTWQNCKTCRKSFHTEIYVWYGTNEYNFEKLEDPPRYEPTHCDRCGVVIKLGTDGYSQGPRGTLCERCTELDSPSHPPPPARRIKPRTPKPKLPINPDKAAIEILLSARAQSHWRFKPALRASESPAHWLGQWRVDFAQRPDRTRWVLVTNTTTLYTFLLAAAEGAGTREGFERLFRLRLGFAFTDAPSLAPWRSAPLVFVAGNPRAVVGSMNDMQRLVGWSDESPSWSPMKTDEDFINRTPFGALGMGFPDKEFARRLAEANRR